MKILLILLLSNFSAFNHQAEINYKEIFGSNYSWAVNWLAQHDEQIKKYALDFNLPDKELKSIVFPELIRYNMVFDAIEVESLKYLYVTEGKHYADFSVGYFQMKPSFAEMVENDAVNQLDSNFIKRSGIANWQKSPDDENGRRARVRRITNTDQQIIYLVAFYKLCKQKFNRLTFKSDRERVRFYATCYNAGYHRSESSIVNFQLKNHYYKYNYSAVSAYYFDKE
jgi:hypothetical protein